jgi:hypothetical protein
LQEDKINDDKFFIIKDNKNLRNNHALTAKNTAMQHFFLDAALQHEYTMFHIDNRVIAQSSGYNINPHYIRGS